MTNNTKETPKSLVREFLNFRQQFNKREWAELNHSISLQEEKKAAQVQLDDPDIDEIEARLSGFNR